MLQESPPILETKRLILRSWTLDDADDVYDYAKDPQVGPSAGWKPHENKEESRRTVESFIKNHDVWAVEEKSSGKVIGSVGLHEIDQNEIPENRMLGYIIGRKWWGQGYCPEAAEAILRYGFTQMNLALITVYHYPFNQNSKRVIEKLKFTYEGTLRQRCKVFDGKIYDNVCYSMTREEFFNYYKNV